MKSALRGILFCGLALLLASCGGVGGSGSGGGGGGSNYITINSVTMTPATTAHSGGITVSWDVTYSAFSSLYVMQIYLSEDQNLDTTGTVLQNDHYLTPDTNTCSGIPPKSSTCQVTFSNLPVGQWYVIAHAYVFDTSMNEVTDDYLLPQQLTVTN